MKKQLKLLLAIAIMAVFAIVGVSASQHNVVHAASTYVKVGNWKLVRDYMNTQKYYKTTKKTMISVNWYSHTTKKNYTTKVSLPKNTIIGSDRYSSGSVAPRTLSYHLLKSGLNKGYTAISATMSQKTSFKKVSVPKFMPAWSRGDFALGGKKTIQSLGQQSFALATKKGVQITADGYIELHTNTKTELNAYSSYVKPNASVKINKTTVKGSTRYLYTSKKISGLMFKHVKKSGKYQYRLTLKNQHKPQKLTGDSSDDINTTYYSLYTIGKQTFFTQISDNENN